VGFKKDFIMKILLNNDEEIICKNIVFQSKEVIVTLFDDTIRYLDRVDLVEIIEHHEAIEILCGLVSDVGNLLCDVADLDFEWQQAGYYEMAKDWILKNSKGNFCSFCGNGEELSNEEKLCYKCWKLNSPQA
jgi:hypothetical protein